MPGAMIYRQDDPDDAAPSVAADGEPMLERLYRDEAPRLRRQLRTRLASPEEASDLVQDAFARLIGTGAWRGLRSPEAFLRRIVRNLLVDRSRRLAVRGVQVEIDEARDVVVPPRQSEELELAQMQRRYRAAVAELPPRMREVFVLHRVEELSYREIAGRLDISTRTVEWHMAEAILRIGKMLEER